MPPTNGSRGTISVDPKRIEDLEHRLTEATKTIDELHSQLRTMGETANTPLFDAIVTMS